jgi:hypothetical protein
MIAITAGLTVRHKDIDQQEVFSTKGEIGATHSIGLATKIFNLIREDQLPLVGLISWNK